MRATMARFRIPSFGSALAPLLLLGALAGCAPHPEFDVVLRGGTIYDGSGAEPVVGDLGIRDDRIAAVGDLGGAGGATEIDVRGLAVTPGFINMLSWATTSLLVDPLSQSDLRQGVTLEVFGEGMSMGPLTGSMKEELVAQEPWDIEVDWTTLGEYLESLERRGVVPNVASFVGATTVRVHVLGYDDRLPDPAELDEMRRLVRVAMEEGALGVGSSLIYAPAFYADTEELIELCKVAAEYDGMYISHMRSEANRLLEAVEELITIARKAGVRAEIYHLKAAGKENWDKMDQVIARVEEARANGLEITADMYTYTAGATGLNATMPPWVQEGGLEAWSERLRDPAIRARVEEEMRTPTDEWENMLVQVGSPENVLLVGFLNPELRGYTGKTLAEVAQERRTTPEATAIDLVLEDGSRVEAIYFLMTEANLRKQLTLPWVSFGSDAASQAPEGVFLESSAHPRTYGNFARLLGKYVRDEQVLSLPEAVRRLTSLPADTLRVRDRGRLVPGAYADVAVFDPAEVRDQATFTDPHRYATGMVHVFVNGVQALRDGEPTGATPGRVVRGPGWTGFAQTGSASGEAQ